MRDCGELVTDDAYPRAGPKAQVVEQAISRQRRKLTSAMHFIFQLSLRGCIPGNGSFDNSLILRSGLVECLLEYWMNRVPAVAVCLAIASTLMMILASVTAANDFLSYGANTTPDAHEDSEKTADNLLAWPDVGAQDLAYGSFELHPEVLNFKSCGKYVTGMLVLPDGRSVRDVFIPSVMLNGVVYASTSFGPHNMVVDFENKETLMLKFDKEWVKEILSSGPSVAIWIIGSFVDGTGFVAVGEPTMVV